MARWAGLIFLLLGIGLCGSVIAVGLALSAPHRAEIGPPPSTLANAEAVAIPSASGSLLQGWWLSGQPGAGAVILMHGIWENRLRMLRRAQVLHQHGFSVLLFDLQAHGQSTGTRITFGRLEGMDAASAVSFVRGRAPGERVGVIGVSLGGAAALLGPGPLPVEALVLESVFPTIDAALTNRLHAALDPVLGRVTPPLLAPMFEAVLPPILGVAPVDLRPIDRIAGVTAPVLVASGTADDRTPLAEAEALFARAPEPKWFWPVPGAGHEDLERFEPGAYWRVVTPFLASNLRAMLEPG